MQVRLVPEISYRVETTDGKSLGSFSKQGDEWEGMMKLVGNGPGKPHVIIVQAGEVLDRLFSDASDRERVAVVASISPELAEQIQAGETEKCP